MFLTGLGKRGAQLLLRESKPGRPQNLSQRGEELLSVPLASLVGNLKLLEDSGRRDEV